MEIPRFEFMHWAKRGLEPAPFPLGGSGTRSPAPGDVALPEDVPFPPFGSAGDEGGFPELRRAIAEAHGTDPDHVLVSDGASLANFTAIRAHSRPGRTVLVETPAYAALTTLPTLHGARVRPLHRRDEEGWLPRLDDVRAAAEAGDLDLVVLSRLHNPSGADLPTTFLDGLAALAEAHDFVVLLDEVYLAFVGGTPGFHTSARFVSTGSLTKVQGFGGLRLGWILADPERLAPCHELSYWLAVNTSAPSQVLGRAVLARNDHWVRRARELAALGLGVFEEWRATRDDISGPAPAGGLNVFLRLENVADTRGFADRVLAERGVALAPGEHFGAPGWVRISVSAPEMTLREALVRLGAALDDARG